MIYSDILYTYYITLYITSGDTCPGLHLLLCQPISRKLLFLHVMWCAEECMLPRGSDVALTNKLTALHAEHPHFSRPKFASNDFIVAHYAGPVCYRSAGFLEKNRDTLQVSLLRPS